MSLRKRLKKSKVLFFNKVILFLVVIFVVFLFTKEENIKTNNNIPILNQPTPTPKIVLKKTTQSKILQNTYHVFQTFNNCGPAALSMALSYYGINQTQQKLGEILRPYQNPQGNNDDKSVTLAELAELAKSYNLIPYHRPNGNIELIKLFISYDIPVITRTLLKENEDIGHYRVIKGFDELTHELIQDDSLQGKNLLYSYEDFNALWKQFNYEYLVLVPPEKKEIAEAILKDNSDEKTAWENAVKNAKKELEENSNDIYAWFNLSVAYYNIGEYKKAVDEFEKVENTLPFRTLWYQIEPIKAYYQLENYDRVITITDKILNNHNRAFSELYLIRGEIYQKQGHNDIAKSEFEKAVFYNKNLLEAQEALASAN